MENICIERWWVFSNYLLVILISIVKVFTNSEARLSRDGLNASDCNKLGNLEDMTDFDKVNSIFSLIFNLKEKSFVGQLPILCLFHLSFSNLIYQFLTVKRTNLNISFCSLLIIAVVPCKFKKIHPDFCDNRKENKISSRVIYRISNILWFCQFFNAQSYCIDVYLNAKPLVIRDSLFYRDLRIKTMDICLNHVPSLSSFNETFRPFGITANTLSLISSFGMTSKSKSKFVFGSDTITIVLIKCGVFIICIKCMQSSFLYYLVKCGCLKRVKVIFLFLNFHSVFFYFYIGRILLLYIVILSFCNNLYKVIKIKLSMFCFIIKQEWIYS